MDNEQILEWMDGPVVRAVLVPGVAGVVVLRVEVVVARGPGARRRAHVVLAVPERGGEVPRGHGGNLCKRGLCLVNSSKCVDLDIDNNG